MPFVKKTAFVLVAVTFFCLGEVKTASSQSDMASFFWESPTGNTRNISSVGLAVISYLATDETVQYFLSATNNGEDGIAHIQSVFQNISDHYDQNGGLIQLDMHPFSGLGYDWAILTRDFLVSAETDDYPDLFNIIRAADAELNGLNFEPFDVNDQNYRGTVTNYITWLILAFNLMEQFTEEGKLSWSHVVAPKPYEGPEGL
jgi:hypothetical protein